MIESININRNFKSTELYFRSDTKSLLDAITYKDSGKELTEHDKHRYILSRIMFHPLLSKLTEIKFKPGINLIYASNGSGKSTLLSILATLFHAKQNYSSHVTNHSSHRMIDDLFSFGFDFDKRLYKDILKLIDIKHDGKSLHYFDPDHMVGFSHRGHEFDFDFSFKEGGKTQNLSSGQQILKRLEQFFNNKEKEIIFKKSKDSIRESYNGEYLLPFIESFFEPKLEPGDVTYILDEPTRSLDTLHEAEFWKSIQKLKNKQIIIATHSPFGFFVKDANFIELEPGYVEQCKKFFKL